MIFKVPSLKLTWHLKMMVSNRNLLFQGCIFRCYVSFKEGRSDLQESDGFKSPHFRLAVRISEDDALKFARIDERLFQLSGTPWVMLVDFWKVWNWLKVNSFFDPSKRAVKKIIDICFGVVPLPSHSHHHDVIVHTLRRRRGSWSKHFFTCQLGRGITQDICNDTSTGFFFSHWCRRSVWTPNHVVDFFFTR